MSLYVTILSLLWFTSIYFLAARPIIRHYQIKNDKILREELRFFKVYMVKRYYSNFEELNISDMSYAEIKDMYNVEKSYQKIRL